MHPRSYPYQHPLHRAVLIALAALLGSGLGWPAPAQAQATAPSAPRTTDVLRGKALDGRHFDLQAQRGRVVMVVLWRTDCGVCLNKMPELRANALGWKGKPFDLVTLSLDPQRSDTDSYDRTRRLVAATDGPVWSFWQGDVQWNRGWSTGTRLPVTLVFDREGALKERHEGRVPAEVWDSVADLLP